MTRSFVTTVFNEEISIRYLLDSLLSQSLLPDEIVITDAYSKDKTFEIINEYEKIFKKKKPSLKYTFLKKKGNRSVGRNAAIKKSISDVMVLSDAGCILDKHWFERMTKAFNDDIEVVAGFYKPLTHNPFEKSLATYMCVPKERVNQDFLPSSRSIAFKKSAWRKVKGYPEDLNTCEDLVFARNMKKAGLKFKVIKNAIVYWPQRKNIFEAARQFFEYAKGDGQALYFRPQTPLLFFRFLASFVLVIFSLKENNYLLLTLLICIYMVWSILKNYRYVKILSALFYLPLLQIVSDITVFSGTIVGIGRRLMMSNKRKTKF